jgi:hypothetical protein
MKVAGDVRQRCIQHLASSAHPSPREIQSVVPQTSLNRGREHPLDVLIALNLLDPYQGVLTPTTGARGFLGYWVRLGPAKAVAALILKPQGSALHGSVPPR